jgi:hypothetical protein
LAPQAPRFFHSLAFPSKHTQLIALCRAQLSNNSLPAVQRRTWFSRNIHASDPKPITQAYRPDQ